MLTLKPRTQFHSIFDSDAERELEAEVEVEEPEEMELEEPIPEEDEEDEELFREPDMPKLPSEPPVLNSNISPASRTFSIP